MNKLSVLSLAFFAFSFDAFSNPKDAHEFRDIFLQVLTDSSQKAAINDMLYAPKENHEEIPFEGESAEDFLALIDSKFKKVKIEEYVSPIQEISESEGDSSEVDFSEENELTIFIVPGIFGEFIETKVFQEVLREGEESELSKEFVKRSKESKLTSLRFDLDKFTLDKTQSPSVETPLHELFKVVPLENNGQKVTVVWFTAPSFSIETLGNMSYVSSRYIDRLHKFFKLMPELQKNIAFVGYSRGTLVALDLLAKARSENISWLPNLRAMVSLGGVTYGSDIADLTFCEDPGATDAYPKCKTVAALERLIDSFELIGQTPDMSYRKRLRQARKNLPKIAANNKRWLSFIRDTKNSPQEEEVQLVEEDEDNNAFRSIYNFFKNDDIKTFIGFDLSSVFGLVIKTTFESFHLPTYFSDYDQRKKRFSWTIQLILQGARQLQTSSRLEWWRNNEVPTEGVKYYAISATMAPESSTLASSSYGFNHGSLDHKMLVDGYNDYLARTGFEFNDSQVSGHKVWFWQSLNERLNPYYKENPMNTSVLGILGTHHWGMALENANKMEAKRGDETPVNPFPRKALLQALAVKIARDINSPVQP